MWLVPELVGWHYNLSHLSYLRKEKIYIYSPSLKHYKYTFFLREIICSMYWLMCLICFYSKLWSQWQNEIWLYWIRNCTWILNMYLAPLFNMWPLNRDKSYIHPRFLQRFTEVNKLLKWSVTSDYHWKAHLHRPINNNIVLNNVVCLRDDVIKLWSGSGAGSGSFLTSFNLVTYGFQHFLYF